MKRLIVAAVAAFTLVCAPSVAHASITRTGNTFTASPAQCSCVTTIDGYLFSGVPYYNPSSAVDSAVELWWALEADPGYQPLPPITSVSTTSTVSGTVTPPTAQADRSSWG